MAKPLLNIHSENEPYCEYPTTLKVPMDDGTIQTYVLENKTSYQYADFMRYNFSFSTGTETSQDSKAEAEQQLQQLGRKGLR